MVDFVSVPSHQMVRYGTIEAKNAGQSVAPDIFYGVSIKHPAFYAFTHSAVEPGLVGGTEFSAVRFRGDAEKASKLYEGADALTPENIAETVHWVAPLPVHVHVNTVELMPVSQAFATLAIHRSQTAA